MQHQPPGEDECQRAKHTVQGGVKFPNNSAEEEVGGAVEIDDAGAEVDGDGVHADDDEEVRPVPEADGIDNEIEHGEQDQAPCCAMQDEGRVPEFLAEDELGSPQLAEQVADDASAEEDEGVVEFVEPGLEQECPGEGAEQCGDDGGDGYEDALGVVVGGIHFPGEQGLVDVRVDGTFSGEHACAVARDRNPGMDSPVAEENAYRPDDLVFDVGKDIDEGGEEVGQTDKAEYTAVADLLPVGGECQGIVKDGAEENEQNRPDSDFAEQLQFGRALFDLFAEREGHRNTGEKQEEGENEIVEGKAGVASVSHLSCVPLRPLPLGVVGKSFRQAIATDNPQHIEATKGIEGTQAFAFYGSGFQVGRCGVGSPGRGFRFRWFPWCHVGRI